MRVGMVRMDMARRLNAHRVLSLVLCSLALVGWGAFADLCAELTQLKASQDQLLAERKQQQEAVGDLIPTRADHHALAQSRRPMDMMSQGWSMRRFQASQQ